MRTKNVAVRIKATTAEDNALADGQFVALASVFNNVDAYGDVVLPGAFADDLKSWKDNGESIPLYWGHRMDDPDMCIGSIVEAAETDEGLQVKAQLDLDTPRGQQVYRLLKGKRVNRMSFAYDITDGGWGERGDQEVYELRKLKIHEISVVQVPANSAAVVRDVKNRATFRKGVLRKLAEDADPAVASLVGQADQAVDTALAALTAADEAMDAVLAALGLPDAPDDDTDADDTADSGQLARAPRAKAGRVLSAKNEDALRSAMTAIKSVLDSLDSNDSSNDDGKASPNRSAASEEPDGAKGDAPAGCGSVSDVGLRIALDVLDVDVLSLTDDIQE